MNWLIKTILKEARRFKSNDEVRYFTSPLKGRGHGIVHTPVFRKGIVRDFDQQNRRYRVVDNEDNSEIFIHPRNLVPNTPVPTPIRTTIEPDTTPTVEPFPR